MQFTVSLIGELNKNAFVESYFHADKENYNHIPECARGLGFPITVSLKNDLQPQARVVKHMMTPAYLRIRENDYSFLIRMKN